MRIHDISWFQWFIGLYSKLRFRFKYSYSDEYHIILLCIKCRGNYRHPLNNALSWYQNVDYRGLSLDLGHLFSRLSIAIVIAIDVVWIQAAWIIIAATSHRARLFRLPATAIVWTRCFSIAGDQLQYMKQGLEVGSLGGVLGNHV